MENVAFYDKKFIKKVKVKKTCFTQKNGYNKG